MRSQQGPNDEFRHAASAEAVLSSPAMRERLAAIEHERWSHWQRYLHSKCQVNDDGSLTIPADLAERWRRQFETAFEDLSEQEKASDREQIESYLPVIVEALRAARDGVGPQGPQ